MFRPNIQPLVWHHSRLHYLLHLLSYKKQNNYPLMVKNICVSRLPLNLLMLTSVSNHRYWIMKLIISYILTHMNNNVLWLNVCCNHHVLKIIWRLFVLTNNYAKGLLLNTNVWTTLKRYINMHVSLTTNKTSRIF